MALLCATNIHTTCYRNNPGGRQALAGSAIVASESHPPGVPFHAVTGSGAHPETVISAVDALRSCRISRTSFSRGPRRGRVTPPATRPAPPPAGPSTTPAASADVSPPAAHSGSDDRPLPPSPRPPATPPPGPDGRVAGRASGSPNRRAPLAASP